MDFPEKNLLNYYKSINKAVSTKNCTELSRLISIDCAHRPSFIRLLHQHDGSQNILVDPAWVPIVESHIRTVRYIHESNLQEAFNEKAISSHELAKILQTQKETNWCIGFMYTHSVDLRRLAIKADADIDLERAAELARAKGGDSVPKGTSKLAKDKNMERACECLMHLFRVCATDTRSSLTNSKRSALDNANILDQCTLAQRVTYNFYLGVKTLFDLRISDAETLLDFVFQNCHPDSRKNIRLTLIFLIPVKMLLGYMPSRQLLEKYSLCQFDDIKKAVITGRIGDLDIALEAHGEFFWRYGIYLIIERLRPIALRNLFKKVHKCANSHLVDMSMLLNAVRLVQHDENIRMEEVHCILANLIYEGKIKGYLSIGHQKLVLSKQNPFPPIAEVIR